MAKIFFATNRDIKSITSKTGKNFGDRFNVMGPQIFRVGEVEVTLDGSPFDTDDDVWKVGRCDVYDEQLNSEKNKSAKLGSADMFDLLRKRLKGSLCDVIVYVHGFASDFPNAARRAAALERLYSSEAKSVIVVMFSWPSNGTVAPMNEYFSDRDDAAASGIAMARTLMRLVEFLEELRSEDRKAITAARREGRVPDEDALKQCERKLHVVAHSMGNWALRHAVNQFADMNFGRVPRVFDNAFLMAADEDADALSTPGKLPKLLQLANRIHVYHADDDRALEVSDKTKGNPDRLGTDGPENLDRLSERIVSIDCSAVSDTTLSHGRHQYYRLRKEVIADVQATIAGAPEDERAGRRTVRPGRSWRLIPKD